ncbi:MAG: hypothetical protein IJQ68_08675 [Methanobrevibacter sp.]|uniref:hypothetical protein n=1 Tax=Methanobrevibacter sp. TaxID=66852 RepID=UPI0025FFA729|nr:hypothetical protein [Methanobrevibacter sp.]MBR0272041.1 hypothetical protein [Methanobrevibacter sp.]
MSPEKATVIFRDGWDPIGSANPTEEEHREAVKNIESIYRKIGIILHLEKLTHIDLY